MLTRPVAIPHDPFPVLVGGGERKKRGVINPND